MNAPESPLRHGLFLRFLGSRLRVAYAGVLVVFLWCVGQFFQPDTGFSSLISIGDTLGNPKVAALRAVPHHVYEGTPGYDGAFYVQLALYPSLNNPELADAIDNLPYRARRILFCWTAWALGLGQPAWIVQAHALLNVGCWLALAWLLLHWFPATSWENFLRWAAILFSHGLIMSVRHSLVDGPSLLLIALAMRGLDAGRQRTGAAVLALAGLGKETNLLAGAGIDFDARAPRSWWRPAITLVCLALPLACWIGFIRWKFGPASDPGIGNFTLPFVGWAEKMRIAIREAFAPGASALPWATLAVMVGLTAQWLFLALRPRPADRWWRVGAAFALMMVFLSTPVWEGYPGAATRVLLPMTLAFNLLVPRGRRWLAVLIAGNLTVAASVFEFSPPQEFYELRGERTLVPAVRVIPSKGWHGPERHFEQHWRWSSGPAELRLVNTSGHPLLVAVTGQVSSAGAPRKVRILAGERMLWSGDVAAGNDELRFGFGLPPGETVLQFWTDRPPEKVGTDPRDLAFMVSNLEIAVRAAASR